MPIWTIPTNVGVPNRHGAALGGSMSADGVSVLHLELERPAGHYLVVRDLETVEFLSVEAH